MGTSFVLSARSGGEELVVRVRGEAGAWLYPLSTVVDVDVDGPLGITEVAIEGGSVHVHSSPCRHKICITSGAISRPNDWLACLPNRVFVSIEGVPPENEAVDAVSY